MAERQGARFCLELADTTDIVIVQINVDELLLFIHGASGGEKNSEREHMVKYQEIAQPTTKHYFAN